MVLLVGGSRVEDVPTDSRALLALPGLKESGAQLASTLPKQIGSVGVLYVSQREYAVVSPHDKNITVVGTDDCTTCLAVVLRHPASGAVAVGHFESKCVDGFSAMVSRLSDASLGYFDQSPVHMYIAGSYSDNRRVSEEVIYSLLHYVSKEPTYEVELVSACVGDLNTILRGEIPWPIIYGLGVNVKTGEVFPATFLDKGPDIPLRHARLLTGLHHISEIYDFSSGLLRIGPFHYEPLRSAAILLQESDEFILQHLSTSPDVEPPHVVTQIKETLKHIQDHPFPEITVWVDNRPRYYRKEDTGQWTLVTFSRFE
jgi:protein N-terminal asparagine amidohydrolase